MRFRLHRLSRRCEYGVNVGILITENHNVLLEISVPSFSLLLFA